jgi:hypothetical protein
MQEVFTAICYVYINFLNFDFCFFPVIAKFYLATHSSLILCQTLLVFFKAIQWCDVAAVIHGGKTGNANIDVYRDFEANLVEFNGEDDHVHLLVNYPPKVAISKLVNSLKGVSGHLIRKKGYPTISNKLWGNALWSPSYKILMNRCKSVCRDANTP